MADRPTASTSRAGRPRMRSQSAHLSPCTPVTPRKGKHRTISKQRALAKGKGAGKGKKASRKSSKPIVVVSSDSEDLEVDFQNYCPNQPHEVPADIPLEPNPPADAPVEEQQEQESHINDPIEEPPHHANTPVGDAEAHLLRTEDGMTTHNFPEDQKVGRFCLTLTQEARLWYATLNAQQQQLTREGL